MFFIDTAKVQIRRIEPLPFSQMNFPKSIPMAVDGKELLL